MTTPPKNLQQYRVPLFGASWVPPNAAVETTDEEPPIDFSDHLVLAGGGGEGNSGISNAILSTKFNRDDNSLSVAPVATHGTGADIPYRMAVHPRGDGIICSFPNDCRWFDWESGEDGSIGVKSSDRVLTKLEDVGQQMAFAFSEDGSLLATGGEDGKLRVFKWPSMEVLLDDGETYSVVKDLHFSVDGKFLVSLGSDGPCRVWDVTTSKVVATLAHVNDETFRFCRFSQCNDKDQVLYTIVMHGKGVNIISWRTDSWKRIASKQISRDVVTALDFSIDGKLLAIGTLEGNILILDTSNMRVQMTLKKAHLGLVTAMTFSRDSRALCSVSMDASVRVSLVQGGSSNGFNYWIILLILMLAIAMFILKSKGLIPESLPFH